MIFAGRQNTPGFSGEEASILSALANGCATGLENLSLAKTSVQTSLNLQHLVEEGAHTVERYTKRLETLREIDRAILAADSPEAIARAALIHISGLIPCLRASVEVFDYEADERINLAIKLRGETRKGLGARFPLGAYNVDRLRRGDVHMVEDTASPADKSTRDTLRAEGVRSWFAVPLIAGDALIGVLDIASDEVYGFSGEHIEIAREVADSLAIAIQQADLNNRVRQHASELEQRIAERTAELEAFSYSVSHDLRAPLRAIDGFSRILLDDYGDELDPECNRLLNVIRRNTINVGKLIDDILAFSRLGHREVSLGEVAMAEVAKSVFEELKTTLSDRPISLNVRDLPPAHADGGLIRQVFVNLLSNAIKFTRTKEPSIIEIGYDIEDSENVYYVKDNGVGFDMRRAAKLFEVFQRLHTTEEFEGSGVGLAIVHSIIRRHGGRVWADAKVNEGATIYFTLLREPPIKS